MSTACVFVCVSVSVSVSEWLCEFVCVHAFVMSTKYFCLFWCFFCSLGVIFFSSLSLSPSLYSSVFFLFVDFPFNQPDLWIGFLCRLRSLIKCWHFQFFILSFCSQSSSSLSFVFFLQFDSYFVFVICKANISGTYTHCLMICVRVDWADVIVVFVRSFSSYHTLLELFIFFYLG